MGKSIGKWARSWVVAVKIKLVGLKLANMESESISVDGIKLCDEERAALHAGAIAGLAMAELIARGDMSGMSRSEIVEGIAKAAAFAYHSNLREADDER